MGSEIGVSEEAKNSCKRKYTPPGNLERYMVSVVCQHLWKKLTGRPKSHSALNLVFFATLEGFISFLSDAAGLRLRALPSLQIIHFPLSPIKQAV